MKLSDGLKDFFNYFLKSLKKEDTVLADIVREILSEQSEWNVIVKKLDELLKKFPENSNAIFLQGYCYRWGYGTAKDYKQAIEYFAKIQNENSFAQLIVAGMFIAGDGLDANIQEAFVWMKRSASTGNSFALYSLGEMYLSGCGITIDKKLALIQYIQAAAQGNVDALCRIGDMYLHGEGVEVNIKTAQEYYAKAAKQGSVSAINKLGDLHIQSKAVEDKKTAHDYFLKAANLGSAYALRRLGDLYSRGDGVAVDKKIAQEYYESAAKRRDPVALCNLGVMGVDSKTGVKAAKSPSNYFTKAAALGNVSAHRNLGVMHAVGEGVEKNGKLAIEWLTKAAMLGDAEAQRDLGVIYENGDLVERNYKKAVEWYQKSAALGNSDAQNSLGYMYENGCGVEKNLNEACDWYVQAVVRGNKYALTNLSVLIDDPKEVLYLVTEAVAWLGLAKAQFDMGVWYSEGSHRLEKDAKKAIEWFIKAANQNLVEAQYNIGYMYENGVGVAKNEKLAYEWYVKAALLGDEIAQKNLGVMYAKGKGVEKDVKLACEWLTKAAYQGEPTAQSYLGLMYTDGLMGCDIDTKIAHEWLKKSAAQENEIAKFILSCKYSEKQFLPFFKEYYPDMPVSWHAAAQGEWEIFDKLSFLSIEKLNQTSKMWLDNTFSPDFKSSKDWEKLDWDTKFSFDKIMSSYANGTVLSFAIAKKQWDLVPELLNSLETEFPASLRNLDAGYILYLCKYGRYEDCTPLVCAVLADKPQIVISLLKLGASVDYEGDFIIYSRRAEFESQLDYEVKFCSEAQKLVQTAQQVFKLVEGDSDQDMSSSVETKEKVENTRLKEMLKFLGEGVNARREGLTALQVALKNNNQEAIELLLMHGAELPPEKAGIDDLLIIKTFRKLAEIKKCTVNYESLMRKYEYEKELKTRDEEKLNALQKSMEIAARKLGELGADILDLCEKLSDVSKSHLSYELGMTLHGLSLNFKSIIFKALSRVKEDKQQVEKVSPILHNIKLDSSVDTGPRKMQLGLEEDATVQLPYTVKPAFNNLSLDPSNINAGSCAMDMSKIEKQTLDEDVVFDIYEDPSLDENLTYTTLSAACSMDMSRLDENPTHTVLPAACAMDMSRLDEKTTDVIPYKAAGKENAYVQNNLGVRYANGDGVEKDEKYACLLYRLAIAKGDADAEYQLGLMYHGGRGVEKDEMKACELYRAAAEKGNAEAQNSLGSMYANGRVVEKDEKRACELYQTAANGGSIAAHKNLGDMYYGGRGVAKDEKKAYELYRIAAEKGDAAAQNSIGTMYANGRTLEKDEKRACELYRTAAETGNAAAQRNLGVMYESGRGVELDKKTAFEWYKKAAELGDTDAQVNLWKMYINVDGVDYDLFTPFDELVQMIEKSAAAGNPEAQYELGLIYSKGIVSAGRFGYPFIKNDKKAYELVMAAAIQGLVAAENCLGYMYVNGLGVTKNEIIAHEWYTKAANQGCASSSTQLGLMYLDGRGVEKSIKLACKNFTKAAQQGEPTAQSYLGLMYTDGLLGVDVDIKVAHEWLQKSAAQGDEIAKFILTVKYTADEKKLSLDVPLNNLRDLPVSWHAAYQGKWEILNKIINFCTKNLNLSPKEGLYKNKTVLSFVAGNMQWDLMRDLLEVLQEYPAKLRNLDVRDIRFDSYTNCSALDCAVMGGQFEIVAFLLKLGVSIPVNTLFYQKRAFSKKQDNFILAYKLVLVAKEVFKTIDSISASDKEFTLMSRPGREKELELEENKYKRLKSLLETLGKNSNARYKGLTALEMVHKKNNSRAMWILLDQGCELPPEESALHQDYLIIKIFRKISLLKEDADGFKKLMQEHENEKNAKRRDEEKLNHCRKKLTVASKNLGISGKEILKLSKIFNNTNKSDICYHLGMALYPLLPSFKDFTYLALSGVTEDPKRIKEVNTILYDSGSGKRKPMKKKEELDEEENTDLVSYAIKHGLLSEGAVERNSIIDASGVEIPVAYTINNEGLDVTQFMKTLKRASLLFKYKDFCQLENASMNADPAVAVKASPAAALKAQPITAAKVGPAAAIVLGASASAPGLVLQSGSPVSMQPGGAGASVSSASQVDADEFFLELPDIVDTSFGAGALELGTGAPWGFGADAPLELKLSLSIDARKRKSAPDNQAAALDVNEPPTKSVKKEKGKSSSSGSGAGSGSAGSGGGNIYQKYYPKRTH